MDVYWNVMLKEKFFSLIQGMGDNGVVSRRRKLPFSFALEHSIQGATVLTMTQFLVLLVDVNVKVRSGLTMTALKQGDATGMGVMKV